MEFRLIPGALEEDQVQLLIDAGRQGRIDLALEDVARRIAGPAWLIEDDGTLLSKAGDPPSELTFEIRKLIARECPSPDETTQAVSFPPREGTSVRRVPALAALPVAPMAWLVLKAVGPEAGVEPAGRLANELLEAIWIVPGAVVLHMGHGGPLDSGRA